MMRIKIFLAAVILMVLLPDSSDRLGSLFRGTAQTPVVAAPVRVKVLTWSTHAGRDTGGHVVVSQQIAWIRSLRAEGVRVVNLNAVRQEDLDDWQQAYPHAIFAPAGGQQGEKLYALLLSDFPFQAKVSSWSNRRRRKAFDDLNGDRVLQEGISNVVQESTPARMQTGCGSSALNPVSLLDRLDTLLQLNSIKPGSPCGRLGAPRRR